MQIFHFRLPVLALIEKTKLSYSHPVPVPL